MNKPSVFAYRHQSAMKDLQQGKIGVGKLDSVREEMEEAQNKVDITRVSVWGCCSPLQLLNLVILPTGPALYRNVLIVSKRNRI
jgi:hypothetical protein